MIIFSKILSIHLLYITHFITHYSFHYLERDLGRFVNDVHPSNALFGIEVTESGTVNDENEEHKRDRIYEQCTQ